MNATVAALLGSLVGAGAALAGTILTSIVTLKTERRRQESKIQARYVDALRKRSGAAFAQFFIIVQEIEWISWCGVNDPDAVDGHRIKSYEDRVNEAYGILLGSMATTASLSLPAYDEMHPILSGLYDLESRVGATLRKFRSERSTAIEELTVCRSEAAALRESLPQKLNHIMTTAETLTSSKTKPSHLETGSVPNKAAVLSTSRPLLPSPTLTSCM
jgi:hypothetical protein